MEQKRSLDSHAVRYPANGETFGQAAVLAFDDDALEHLNALFVAFSDPRVDLDGIARSELGGLLFLLHVADEACHIHENCYPRRPLKKRRPPSWRPDAAAASRGSGLRPAKIKNERCQVYHRRAGRFKTEGQDGAALSAPPRALNARPRPSRGPRTEGFPGRSRPGRRPVSCNAAN